MHRDLQGRLEALSDAHHADVVIAHAQGPQEFLVGGVSDLKVLDHRGHLVGPGLILFHRHHIVSLFLKFNCHMAAKPPKSNDQN